MIMFGNSESGLDCIDKDPVCVPWIWLVHDPRSAPFGR